MAGKPRRTKAGSSKTRKAGKAELAVLCPNEIKDDFIPALSAELDAIGEAISEATDAIMDSAETIDGIGDKLGGGKGQSLMNATSAIYQACGFQDITGQRLNKVRTTLKDIEDMIDPLIAALGAGGVKNKRSKAKSSKSKAKSPKKPLADEYLLEGPQGAVPDNAVKCYEGWHEEESIKQG